MSIIPSECNQIITIKFFDPDGKPTNPTAGCIVLGQQDATPVLKVVGLCGSDLSNTSVITTVIDGLPQIGLGNARCNPNEVGEILIEICGAKKRTDVDVPTVEYNSLRNSSNQAVTVSVVCTITSI